MARNHAESLDAALTKPSLEVYDDLLNAYYSGDRLLSADKIGDIDARRHAQSGNTIDGIDAWIPGRDKVVNLDVQKSLESGEPRTKTRTEPSSPNVLHVALDLPRRLETIEGRYLVKNIGLFALGVTAVIARETSANIKLYTSDGERSSVVFDDPNLDDLYVAYEDMEQDRITPGESMDTEPGNLNGLLSIVDSHIDYDDDGLVIISDFQDGYDGATFEWENTYSALQMALGGRLRSIQLRTPSHLRPNLLQAELPASVLARIEADYSEKAHNKQQHLADILGEQALRFDTTETMSSDGLRPSELLSQYIAHGRV